MKNKTMNKIGQIMPTSLKNTMKKLIPVLSKKEKQEIFAYYTVYEKYEEEFSKKATEDLKDHPVFGGLIKDIPKEVSAASNKLSRELQKDAIMNDNWQPYIEYQIEQGIMYAKMGLDFKSWYEVVSLVRNYITPYLQKEYGIGAKLILSLNGMNRFLDIAMGIIGEAYIQEKEGLIKEDREKIKKLNEELEQKVIERTAELQKSKDMFSDLFNYNPASLTINRADDGRIMNCNNSFLSLFGFSTKEEIIDKTSTELNLQTNPRQVEETFKMIKEKEFVNNKEICIRNKHGNLIWVSSSILRIDIDNTPCFLTVSIDITDRKKAEEQLLAVNNELEAFSYSVSHDLRGPLRAIDGFSRILLQDYMNILDDEGKRLLSVVSNNTRKMGQLIDDILSFSRMGRKEIGLSEINMEKLVKDVLGELNTDADGRKIKIEVKPLPNAHADASMMRQVFVNLLSNALKFTSTKDAAVIEVGCNSTGLPLEKKVKNKFAENIYYVKDNGVGFDMMYATKLFGVFQRLHGVDEFEGTGIGLAIVKRVIDRHGGRVWAEGKINEGATFSFTLPRIILKR